MLLHELHIGLQFLDCIGLVLYLVLKDDMMLGFFLLNNSNLLLSAFEHLVFKFNLVLHVIKLTIVLKFKMVDHFISFSKFSLAVHQFVVKTCNFL